MIVTLQPSQKVTVSFAGETGDNQPATLTNPTWNSLPANIDATLTPSTDGFSAVFQTGPNAVAGNYGIQTIGINAQAVQEANSFSFVISAPPPPVATQIVYTVGEITGV